MEDVEVGDFVIVHGVIFQVFWRVSQFPGFAGYEADPEYPIFTPLVEYGVVYSCVPNGTEARLAKSKKPALVLDISLQCRGASQVEYAVVLFDSGNRYYAFLRDLRKVVTK